MSPQQELGRHEIPTHLGVADKAFGGLTMRQLLSAAAGLALAYGAASDLPLPLPARLLAAALVLAATLLLVLWRPAGRPLEEWLFVLGRYHAVPRVAVWRPCERPVPPRATREVVLRPRTEPHEQAVRRRPASAQERPPRSAPPGQPVTTKGGVHVVTP